MIVRNEAFPLADKSNTNGTLLMIANGVEIEEMVNKTFPEILRSGVNPYEYLKMRGYNITGTAILPFITNQNTHGM